MIGFASMSLEIVLLASPVLLVYLFGAILAIAFWRRCPAASGLILSGACLSLFAFFAQLVVPQAVAQFVFEQWGREGLAMVHASVPFTCGAIHAIGLALLLGAALVGRGGSAPSGAEEVS